MSADETGLPGMAEVVGVTGFNDSMCSTRARVSPGIPLKKANEIGQTTICKGASRARTVVTLSLSAIRPFTHPEKHDNGQGADTGETTNNTTDNCPDRD